MSTNRTSSCRVMAVCLLWCSVHSPWSLCASAADELSGLLRMEVHPESIHLQGTRASVQMIVTGYFAGDEVRDLTHVARYQPSDSIRVTEGRVTSCGAGPGTIEIVCGSQRLSVSVEVAQWEDPAPVSFRRETLAVLTKQGCNSGSCHGKPNGRGALELSLNAFDPAADERTLIRAPLLRFTHPLDPSESLLLKKPLLQLPHGGGKRLKQGDSSWAILQQWIEEGCQPDPPGTAECVQVDVYPDNGRVLRLPGPAQGPEQGSALSGVPATQQMRVVARFRDGTQQDVTQIASWSTSSPTVATVSPEGLVTGLDRGQTAIVVRYLDFITSRHLTFVRDLPGFQWTDPPENNVIDQLVNNKLRQLQYLPSELCDDSVFIRRLSLDVRGLLPTVAETEEFLKDTQADKRVVWIDRFLESPEYSRFWGMRLADLLRVNKKVLSETRAEAYSRWIFDSVARNQPYDEFVRELLTSRGETGQHPAASFFRVTSDTNAVTETVAQLFLGSRVMCAQCHNHPYESWTQDNYYQMGAAFHELDRHLIAPEDAAEPETGKRRRTKPDAREAEMMIAVSPGRTLANPRTGIVQPPWPTDVPRARDEDKREAFTTWLTAPGNPWFARVAVNRMWAHLLGRGLVEPIDDFRSSNPPVNVELLDALAEDFERSGYDRRHTLRLILNSRTWQASSSTHAWNADDELLFSHARVRLLSAEQMQDAIRRVCESHIAGQDPPEGDWMTQRPYPEQTSFLTAFGQPPRETACACERRTDTSLDQALQLMNSELMRMHVQTAANGLMEMNDEALVQHLYLAALSRPPEPSESARLTTWLSAAPDRREAIEDIVWAVLNTNEFLFQH